MTCVIRFDIYRFPSGCWNAVVVPNRLWSRCGHLLLVGRLDAAGGQVFGLGRATAAKIAGADYVPAPGLGTDAFGSSLGNRALVWHRAVHSCGPGLPGHPERPASDKRPYGCPSARERDGCRGPALA
jgi:hypothetical protein